MVAELSRFSVFVDPGLRRDDDSWDLEATTYLQSLFCDPASRGMLQNGYTA